MGHLMFSLMTDAALFTAELWAAGAPLSDMGLKLGESRSVIAGRIARARARGDGRFGPRPPKPRPAGQVARPPVAKPIAVVTPVRPMPFVELPLTGRCSFPINSPPRGGVLMCCAKAVVTNPRGAVYCAEHLALTHHASSSRAPSAR